MRDVLEELKDYTFMLMRPPQKQTVSEWADKNCFLPSENSAERGRWRTDRAPYQREIMDAFTQPGVYEIVLMAGAQVGKSAIELNMIGYVIDNDPGPILYVQPTEKAAEDFSKRRIAPMIAACPSLRKKVSSPKGRDSGSTILAKTFPDGNLTIIGANSPADLASKPIRYLFMDETDRFPLSAGAEGDPQELAIRRTETFRDIRKIVKASTPTIKGTSNIEKDYLNGTQEEWRTQCPACHTYSFIKFGDIKFHKEDYVDKSGEKDFHVLSAVWCCPACKHEVSEYACKRLPGRWESNNPNAIQNGIRSFRLNSFMSPWSSWKEIVYKFLKAGKDPELLKTVYNTMFGETWEIRSNTGLEEKLYNRREHYNAEVPDGVLLLTMGMDTQDNRLEYEVVGWDRDGQSWGISRGVIPGRADAQGVWNEVDALLEREWETASGVKLRILATFIDSGGHHTQTVYRECEKRSSKRIWPIKGDHGEGKPECRPMKRNQGDGAKFMLGVDAGKEGVMYEAGVNDPGPKYMHFPLDPRAGYDREFFRGLISERLEIHRKAGRAVATWHQFYARNEPLDCRNYARLAYRYFNWNFAEYERMILGLDRQERIHTQAEETRRKQRRIISSGIRI